MSKVRTERMWFAFPTHPRGVLIYKRIFATRSQLEATVRKYTSGSSGSAFAGKGQTLGGSSPAAPQPEGPGILAAFNKVDPQVRMLLYLLVAYLVFLYVS